LRRGRHHCRPFRFCGSLSPPQLSLGTPEAFFLFTRTQRHRSRVCRIIRSHRNAGAIAILRREGDGRCVLMSLLPGWRLVWSLYGRFWCRSSFEALRVWRWARGHVVEGHVVRPVSGSMTRGVSGDDRDRAAAMSRCRRAMELGRRKPIGFSPAGPLRGQRQPDRTRLKAARSVEPEYCVIVIDWRRDRKSRPRSQPAPHATTCPHHVAEPPGD
jgi:hypothetical protein